MRSQNQKDRDIGAFTGHYDRHLISLCNAWHDNRVFCYGDSTDLAKEDMAPGSIFLGGGVPLSSDPLQLWYPFAIAELRAAGFKGSIFAPMWRGCPHPGEKNDLNYLSEWENEAALRAGILLYYIPPGRKSLAEYRLAPTVDAILRIWQHHIRVCTQRPLPIFVYYGYPDERSGLPELEYLAENGVQTFTSLQKLCYGVMGGKPPQPQFTDRGDDIPV